MLVKSLLALAFAVATVGAIAQQPAQPLTAMPYSPSLDLTSLDRTRRSLRRLLQVLRAAAGRRTIRSPRTRRRGACTRSWRTRTSSFCGAFWRRMRSAPKRTPVQQKVGDYFEACMNTAAIDAAGDEAAAAGAGADRCAEDAGAADCGDCGDCTMTYGGELLLRRGDGAGCGGLVADDCGAGRGRAGAAGPRLLPEDRCEEREDSRAVCGVYRAVAGAERARRRSRRRRMRTAMLRIETALAKASLTRVERRDPHKTYHMMTVAELRKLAPSIDWPMYFAGAGRAGMWRS